MTAPNRPLRHQRPLSAESPPARPLDRRSVAAVTAVTMAVATFAQVIVSVLAADLIAEFGVDRWQIGALVSASAITGALLSPMFGRATDAVGPVRATQGVLLTGMVFLALIGTSINYVMLALAAVMTGIAQGWANPATNAFIVANIETGRRGVITGIKQSGVQMGTFLGGLLLPPIAALWSWRVAILCFLIVPALALLATRTQSSTYASMRASRIRPGPLPTGVRWVAVYGALSGLATSTTFTYLPLFAEEGQQWTAHHAGLLLSGVGLVGVVARILWGTISERWLGYGRGLLVIAMLSLVATLLLTGAAAGALPSWVLFPAAALFGAGAISWNSVGMLAVMELSPEGMVGRGTGLVLLGFLLGYGMGAPIIGFTVDRLGTYTPGWIGVSLLFLTSAIVAHRIIKTERPAAA